MEDNIYSYINNIGFVQEGVLLDLLKVVSVHGGRLATPVRSMQRHVEETAPCKL